MYCASCGAALKQGLSYCNFCGAKLSGKKAGDDSSEVKAENLVAAMAALFIFGIGAITVLMGVMKAVLNLNVGLIVAFTLLSFLILIVIEGVFIRLLFQRTRRTVEAGEIPVLSKGQTTTELDAAQARGLPEPVASVTEDATRAFEPAYKERTSK